MHKEKFLIYWGCYRPGHRSESGEAIDKAFLCNKSLLKSSWAYNEDVGDSTDDIGKYPDGSSKMLPFGWLLPLVSGG